MKEFSPKAPSERVPITFDFSEQLAATETIIGTPVLTVRAVRALDLTPSALLSGSPSIVGGIVQHLVTGGVLGELYEIRCEVETSLNQVLRLVGIQPVRDPADT